MASHVCVSLSGPALSFLIYENVKSFSDQEGFLLGEIISHVTDTISDTQIRGEKMETLISVNSLMPLPHSVSLYNGVGRVNPEKLKAFLKTKAKEVIGWYNFRRNASLGPYLRDKLLHKELCMAIPHVSQEHFTMCLLNTSVSNAGSTHVFNHKFMRYRHGKFESLRMQIHNLGETQPEYKLVPSTACLSDSYNDIISSLKAGPDKGSDASLVCHIQKALQEHLWRLVNDVATSEVRVAELEKEVEMLRRQPRPLSHEILLPHLLRDDVANINQLDVVGGAHAGLEGAPSRRTPTKALHRKVCSNHVGDVEEEEVDEEEEVGEQQRQQQQVVQEADAGVFFTAGDGKTPAPPPPPPPPPPPTATKAVVEDHVTNNNNNNKRTTTTTSTTTTTTRAMGRGMPRGSRKQQAARGATGGGGGGGGDGNKEAFPALRRGEVPSPGRPSSATPAGKRRPGYSQAVRRDAGKAGVHHPHDG